MKRTERNQDTKSLSVVESLKQTVRVELDKVLTLPEQVLRRHQIRELPQFVEHCADTEILSSVLESLTSLNQHSKYEKILASSGETAVPIGLCEYWEHHPATEDGVAAAGDPVSILIELENSNPTEREEAITTELLLPGKIRAVLNHHCKGKYGISKKFCFGMLDHRDRKFETTWRTIELWRRRCFGSTVKDRESARRLKEVQLLYPSTESIVLTYNELAYIGCTTPQSLNGWRRKVFPELRKQIINDLRHQVCPTEWDALKGIYYTKLIQ